MVLHLNFETQKLFTVVEKATHLNQNDNYSWRNNIEFVGYLILPITDTEILFKPLIIDDEDAEDESRHSHKPKENKQDLQILDWGELLFFYIRLSEVGTEDETYSVDIVEPHNERSKYHHLNEREEEVAENAA